MVGEEKFKVELKKNGTKPLLIMRKGRKQVLQLRADPEEKALRFMLSALEQLKVGFAVEGGLKAMKEAFLKDRLL